MYVYSLQMCCFSVVFFRDLTQGPLFLSTCAHLHNHLVIIDHHHSTVTHLLNKLPVFGVNQKYTLKGVPQQTSPFIASDSTFSSLSQFVNPLFVLSSSLTHTPLQNCFLRLEQSPGNGVFKWPVCIEGLWRESL